MIKKTTILSLVMISLCVFSQPLVAGQAGTTDTVFNRKFIRKIKPMMPYDQLVNLIGTQGINVGKDRSSSTPNVTYHWDGGRNSALDIKVDAGMVVDATVLSPKHKKFSLG